MSKKLGIYVGVNGIANFRELFRSNYKPSEASHGKKYGAVIGPFRTIRGAKAMVHFGGNNPHMQSVSDAERIGKQYAADLAAKGLHN
jgi:hypothetical protein